jgi:hypothetical protein
MAALSPDQLQDMMAPFMDHLFFAYERVVLPCQNMKCGDVVHRRCDFSFRCVGAICQIIAGVKNADALFFGFKPRIL